MHADELADLLRWCAALSTDPAELAGAVLVRRGPALVGASGSTPPADLRELTVQNLPADRDMRPDLAVRGWRRSERPEELRAVAACYDQLRESPACPADAELPRGSLRTPQIAGNCRPDRPPGVRTRAWIAGLAALGGDPYPVRAALDIASLGSPPASAEVSRAFQRQSPGRGRAGDAGSGLAGSLSGTPRSRAGHGQRCAPAPRVNRGKREPWIGPPTRFEPSRAGPWPQPSRGAQIVGDDHPAAPRGAGRRSRCSPVAVGASGRDLECGGWPRHATNGPGRRPTRLSTQRRARGQTVAGAMLWWRALTPPW